MSIAGQRSIDEWDKASMMPPLAFILDRTAPIPVERLTADVLTAGYSSGIKQLGQRSGFSKAEIADMLEAGKETQNEHIAKLEADPEWQAMCARLGGAPGLNAKPLPTEVPSEAEERAGWAKRKAETMGWAE
jgi:hypothetical protein